MDFQHLHGILEYVCAITQLTYSNSRDFNQTEESVIVSKAKKHIEENYLVVGLTSDLAGFFDMLEYEAPSVFGGVAKIYKNQRGTFSP